MSTNTESATSRSHHGGSDRHQAATFASLLQRASHRSQDVHSMLETLIAMARESHSPAERATLRRAIEAILNGQDDNIPLASQLLSLAGTTTTSSTDEAALLNAAGMLLGEGPPVGAGANHPSPKPASPKPTPKPQSSTPAPKPPPKPAPPPTPLTESGNSINTGRYIITFSTSYSNGANSANDGQVQIFDTKTNSFVDVYGDPHVLTSGGQTAHFDKNGLQIDLADGTVVQIKPTSLHNGVAHIADVAVSKNGQTIGASGIYGGNGIHLTGVMNESAGAYDSYFNTGSEDVLVANDSKAGLANLAAMNANGQLVALSTSGDTNLDGSGFAGVAAIQRIEALLKSTIDASLKAELQQVLDTLLDKQVAEGPATVANKHGTVDLYASYNTNDAVSVTVTPDGQGPSQLINAVGNGGKGGPDAIRINVPANDSTYTVTVKDATTGKSYTQTITINPHTFSGASISLGSAGTVDLAGVADPSASAIVQPPAPFSATAMASLLASLAGYQTDFLALLKKQPDKSPGKILYNLYRLIAISQNSNYKGKIDVAKVQADIQSTVKNNLSYFNNLHDQIVGGYAQKDLGASATAAAQSLMNYVDSPAFAKYLLTLNPAEKQTAMNTYVGAVSALDPSLGKKAMSGLLKTMLTLPSQFLNQVQTPDQRQQALNKIISTILDNARLGTGVLNNLSKYLANAGLTQSALNKVAAAISKTLSANLSTILAAEQAHPGSIPADMITSLTAEIDQSLTPAEAGLANRALETLSSKGVIGALGGATSLVGFVTGFTGNSEQGQGAFFIIGQLANASFMSSKLNDLKKLFIDSGSLDSVGNFFKSLAGVSAQKLQQAAQAAKGSISTFAQTIARDAGNPSLASTIEHELSTMPADQQSSVLDNLSTTSGAGTAEHEAAQIYVIDKFSSLPQATLAKAATAANGSIDAFAAELTKITGDTSSGMFETAIKTAFGSLPSADQTAFLNDLKAGDTVAEALGSGAASSTGSFASAQSSLAEYFDAASSFAEATPPPATSGGGASSTSGEIAALESEGFTASEAATVAGITGDITGAAGAGGVEAAGLAGKIGASLTWAKFLKFTGFLGPLGTALYGVGAGDAAYNDFKSGNIPGGVANSLAVASLGVLAAANVAGLVFTTTEWIPVVGEIAGVVTIILSIIAAIFDGGKKDPNQALAQSGVGNGQDYWQPDVTSAQDAAGKGTPTQALITLLEQVQGQNRHMVDGGHVAIPVAGPIVAKLQPLIDQLKALPPGATPSAALMKQIQTVLGVPEGTQISPTSSVDAVDQMTFEDIEARLTPAKGG